MKNKNYALAAAFMLLQAVSCTNATEKNTETQQKTQENAVPEAQVQVSDSLLSAQTKLVLTALKAKDYQTLAGYIHPTLGVVFSPYSYIDTTKSVAFKAATFVAQCQDKALKTWGSYDGSGEPILLSAENYMKEFGYSADFLNADSLALNKTVAKGNSLNNIKEAFGGCYFTESYFAGKNPKFNGMDWSSLRLVYKLYENKLYLVAIVHNQWTT